MNEDDTKPTFFVSRRGRQVGVHEVDMKGIDIESQAQQPQTVKKENKPISSGSQKPVTDIPRKRSQWSKRKKIVGVSIILAIVLFPIAIAELVTAQYSVGTSGAKQDMTKLVNTTVLPLQKKSALTADDIRSVSGKVNDIASKMCRGGLVDNLAKLYPRAKSAHDECKQSQNKYVSLTTNLYTLETQSRYLEGVGRVINPVSTPITDEFAVIGAQQTAWLKASEELKKLNPPSEFKSVHAELVTHVSAVADNWSKINTANGSQDGAGFEEAEKALTIEYEAIRSSSSQYLSILTTTQAQLLAAYNSTK